MLICSARVHCRLNTVIEQGTVDWVVIPGRSIYFRLRYCPVSGDQKRKGNAFPVTLYGYEIVFLREAQISTKFSEKHIDPLRMDMGYYVSAFRIGICYCY
jgi:hypothetical protein